MRELTYNETSSINGGISLLAYGFTFCLSGAALGAILAGRAGLSFGSGMVSQSAMGHEGSQMLAVLVAGAAILGSTGAGCALGAVTGLAAGISAWVVQELGQTVIGK
jgi:hypothetical protein